jgi:hypothetical protein
MLAHMIASISKEYMTLRVHSLIDPPLMKRKYRIHRNLGIIL